MDITIAEIEEKEDKTLLGINIALSGIEEP